MLLATANLLFIYLLVRMRWAGHVARMGQGRGVYRVLVGKPEGKRPLGRPRRRWEDNIKMDLFCFLDRAFSIMRTKINQQNAQINSGLIYY